MDTLFNQAKPHFNAHKAKNHVEFELRLGRINGKMFDTDVGKEIFDKLMCGLMQYKGWEEVKESNTSVYYKDQVRVSVDEDSDETEIVKKIPLVKETLRLEGRPLDVRFAVSLEEPIEQTDEVMDFMRTKKRTSFIRKNLSIDMTVVSGQPEDMDCEEPQSYQVELEIIDPCKVSNDNDFYNIVHKVQNILEVLG